MINRQTPKNGAGPPRKGAGMNVPIEIPMGLSHGFVGLTIMLMLSKAIFSARDVSAEAYLQGLLRRSAFDC